LQFLVANSHHVIDESKFSPHLYDKRDEAFLIVAEFIGLPVPRNHVMIIHPIGFPQEEDAVIIDWKSEMQYHTSDSSESAWARKHADNHEDMFPREENKRKEIIALKILLIHENSHIY